MQINSLEVDIDLEVVLRECGITNWRDRGTDYRASCPHHAERTASWDIHKETGMHNCLGCGYGGSILDLLVDHHPDVENVAQAIQWIFRTFQVLPERPALGLVLRRERAEVVLDDAILSAYDFRHSYLYDRGFGERTLQAFRIGYCKHDVFTADGEDVEVFDAITIPWRDRRKRLRLLKYRPFASGAKYINRGEKKSLLVFGIDKVVTKGASRVMLCEGEFDAIWCWMHGFPAVAIGGAYITRQQVTELGLAGVRAVDIFTDNDTAGRKGVVHAVSALRGFKLREVVYPNDDAKDPNELTHDEMGQLSFRVPIMF